MVHRKLGSLAISSLFILTLMSALITMVPGTASAYAYHAPIAISGNAGFTNASGVNWGSGTEADPYIIDGWEINVSLAPPVWPADGRCAIWIKNADAHFVLRDLYVHDMGGVAGSCYGICIDNSTNGSVNNCVIEDNRDSGLIMRNCHEMSIIITTIGYGYSDGLSGFLASNCTGLTITDIGIANYRTGLWLEQCNYSWVTNSTCDNNSQRGMYVSHSNDCWFINNNCSYNGWDGIGADWSDSLEIYANRFIGDGDGVILVNASDCEIVNNIALGVDHFDEFGAYLIDSSNCSVVGNAIYDCWNHGIIMLNCSVCRAYHNSLFDNYYQAADIQGMNNTFDEGYPGGGNYYSDYSGIDNYSGPNQDIPGSDGIGDTPYLLSGYPYYLTQDSYPLMSPWNWPPPPATDIYPPTTIILTYGTMGANGWYVSDVEINLIATDVGSGVNATYYSFDYGNWNEYTGPFIWNLEGTHMLLYYSRDNANNVENANGISIMIDKTAPGLNDNGIDGGTFILNHDRSVVLSWSGWDSVSQIDYYNCYVEEVGYFTTTDSEVRLENVSPGAYNVSVHAYDVAGNSAAIYATFMVIERPEADIDLESRQVGPGESLNISGNFSHQDGTPWDNLPVTITVCDLHGNNIMPPVAVLTDESGSFFCELTLPADIPAGVYKIVITASSMSWEYRVSVKSAALAPLAGGDELAIVALLGAVAIAAMMAIMASMYFIMKERRRPRSPF